MENSSCEAMVEPCAAPAVSVVALGNPLRRDDGIAQAILAELRALEWPDGVRLVDAGQDGLAVAAEAPNSDNMIVIDAADMGLPAGEVRRVDAHQLAGGGGALSPHTADMAGVLELCRKVAPACRIDIVAIQVADVECGEEMSRALAERVPEIARAVEACVRMRLTEGSAANMMGAA